MGSTDSNCCGSHGLVASDDPDSKDIIGRTRNPNTEPPLKTDPNQFDSEYPLQNPSHRKHQHTISKTSKISNHTFDITANIVINSSSNLQNYNSIPSITFNFDGQSASHSHITYPCPPNPINMKIKNNHTTTQSQSQGPTIYKQHTNNTTNYNNNYNSPTIPIINACPTIDNNININNTSNWIENVYDNSDDDDEDDIDDTDTKHTVTDNENNNTETPISYLSDAQNTQNTHSNRLNSYSTNENDIENYNENMNENYNEPNEQMHEYDIEENKYDLDNMPALQLPENNSDENYVRSVNYLRPEEIINGHNLVTPEMAQNWKKEDMDKLESEMLQEMRRLSVSTLSVTSLNSL